jgi:hypothetical protein
MVITARKAMGNLNKLGLNARNRTLVRAYRPVSMTIPDNNALIGLGASGWASGSQVWRGTIADFTPNPTISVLKRITSHGEAGAFLRVLAMAAKLRDPVIP